MVPEKFNAFVVEEKNGRYKRSIQARLIQDLPPGDLLIKVAYSSLNYKDALSAIGNKGITRNYPHTPGIDAVGTIVHSETPKFYRNEQVIVTSYDLGMDTDGGFGEYIRVPSDWAVKLPEGLSMKEAMILGTAGLTAGISVLRLTEQVKPKDGKIVVSGASGGVGSLSVAILSKLGYTVVAISGKEKEYPFLNKLGAKEIISRTAFEKTEPRPLLKSQYAGGIDTVGGIILENMIKSIHPMGAISCCGNVAGAELNLTVYPFILRGITLIGIGSQNYPMHHRKNVWNKLANEWKPEKMMDICTEISLEELSDHIDLILEGKIKGRVILKLNA